MSTPVADNDESQKTDDRNVVETKKEGSDFEGSDSDSGSDSSSSSSEDDSDEDIIAQKLNEQLLEDIRRAREAAAPTVSPLPNTPKENAALETMKKILALVAADPLAQATLSSTIIPGTSDMNVFDTLRKIVSEGRLCQQTTGQLSQALVSLAKSVILFPPLPVAKKAASKRKRDDKDAALRGRAKRGAKSGGKGGKGGKGRA